MRTDTSSVSRLTAQYALEITICDHCGLPALPDADDGPHFCCAGCRGAYQLIHDWGLEDYYELRTRLLVLGAEPDRTVANLAWEEWDDAELLGESQPRHIGDGLVSSRLAIAGIHCAACVWLIERMPTIVPGLREARVGMHEHSIEITFDPLQTKLGQIAAQLSSIGYRVFPWMESEGLQRHRAESRRRLEQIAIAGFCAMNAMWIAIAIYAGEYSGIAPAHHSFLRTVGVSLGLVAALGPGREFFRGAWAAFRTSTPHMDLPISLGVGVGAVAGVGSVFSGATDVYFDSVAALVFLLLVGRWIQFRQQHRAADAVSLLMRLTPAVAIRINQVGEHQKVPANSLNAGDRVYVVAGAAVPVDGVVASGHSSIDRSMLTGESLPVAIRQGDVVEAGVLNLRSPITLIASASLADSRASKLMKLVEAASLKRTPIVQLADSIAGKFVVVVLCLAAFTLAVWWAVDPQQATNHAVALLIVACPCALGLATPLAIAITLGRAAQQRVLIRSGDTLERLSKTGTIWFDKTGTLTSGRPRANADCLDDDTLRRCARLESQSTHPLARAIVSAAEDRNLALLPADQVSQVDQTTGAGIRGLVDGKRVSIGTTEFVKQSVSEWPETACTQVNDMTSRGVTPVAVAVEGEFKGFVEIGDCLRVEAVATIDSLRDRGWKIGILSGDHPGTVEVIASRLGIEPAWAAGGLSPEQKLARIEAAKQSGHSIIMVGDGINDAAALSAADVGMAVRGGAEASLQAAPVYLIDGNLMNVVKLIDASQRAMAVIGKNFRISLCYNSVSVLLAAGGFISPLFAAILMPISSLTILSLTLASKTFVSNNHSAAGSS